MGIATGVISGIVLLIVTGIKNTWVYMLEEKVKWLDAVHVEILSYMGKEKAYLRFRQENTLEDCYNYVYDFGADASNINAKISQAQFSKILPFNPDKYFLKKYDVPPLPIESQVIESINDILQSDKDKVDIAIELCMYCMRTQVFLDGNKRASVIFANHFMISHGLGLIVIPENHVPEFKKKLVHYYESADIADISEFLKTNCWKKM
jgi:prophage maintenance system killer protein